jgi:SCP-2 sterol transfer family
VARFLSQEWFAELPAVQSERDAPDLIAAVPDLVVEVAVSGGPAGDVRYQVVVRGEHAGVVSQEGAFLPAQVEMKSDYATMAGIASGQLSPIDALSAGQARVSGDIAALSSRQSTFLDLDMVPASTRASTTF